MSQLNDLEALLTSNENILHQAMRDSDKVLEDAKRRTVPNIDEVLVAPTVVAEQLYQSVAEERAIEESRGVLARALDKGKIGGGVWAKVCKGSCYTGFALTVSSEANQEPSKRRISQKGTDQKDRERYGYFSGRHVDLTRKESTIVSKKSGLSLVPLWVLVLLNCSFGCPERRLIIIVNVNTV